MAFNHLKVYSVIQADTEKPDSSQLYDRLPSHFCEISLNLCPAGHLHSKDPTVLMQFPPWQMPGMAWHSSTSVCAHHRVNMQCETHVNLHADYCAEINLEHTHWLSLTHKCGYPWMCLDLNWGLSFLRSTVWQRKSRGISPEGGTETEAKLGKKKRQNTGLYMYDHMRMKTNLHEDILWMEGRYDIICEVTRTIRFVQLSNLLLCEWWWWLHEIHLMNVTD